MTDPPSPTWLLILLSILGSIFAGLLFTSLIPTWLQFYKKQTVGDYPPLPMLSILVQCFLWSIYGYVVQDLAVFFLNAYGVWIAILYCFGYYSFSSEKSKKFFLIMLAVCAGIIICCVAPHVFFGPNYFKVLGDDDVKYMKNVIGIAANIFNVIMYASPLSSLYTVFKQRSVQSMSFLLLCCALGSSHAWLFYGWFKPDPYIWIPNLIGSIFNWLQVVIFAIFWPMDRKRKRLAAQARATNSGEETSDTTPIKGSAV